MNHDVAWHAVTAAALLRVFVPDVRICLRRLAGAGVRIGAAELREQSRSLPPNPQNPVTGEYQQEVR
ncbi:hypothetical protein QMK19_19520 [Streptomyces sp. H10-C2]|uniref:hypothetical protein n=1 Tax=unclassified Streptomyces TaxID=2593676 RepID=UPI0024B8EDF0|nr:MULTISPECIES: hypothetical protein [unclassified Streptomyces]MDJ0343382.1 hypothetical protein [Streptomyces sp. PH10-H1]MDJ0371807.1 hypothetical protein [Streptomyces sp. H10-C2]